MSVSAIVAAEPTQLENSRRVVAALRDAGFEEIRQVTEPAERPLFARARLVNAAVRETRAARVFVVHPDMMLPFAEIAERLRRDQHAFVQPFSSYRRPNGEERSAPPGKASWIVDRELLCALGGLSEAFVGRADEGLELVRRLRAFVRDEAHWDFRGDELPRARAPFEADTRRTNQAQHRRLCEAIDADPERYVSERLETSFSVSLERLRATVRDRQRRAAFRIEHGEPAPTKPARLSGSLWGITAYFNPAGYASKKRNFDLFRSRLGIPLVAVELAFGDAPFELAATDAERVLALRGSDVLWQKERLLNLALRELPRDCDKVVWLDADVLFERTDWAAETARALERWVVVQPFSRSVRLLPGETSLSIGDLPLGPGEHQVLHSMAFGVFAKGSSCLGRYLVQGHSGYAWAARRRLLETHGLYDANVLGNADLNIAHALFAGSAGLRTERLSERARAHLARWADAIHRDVEGSVGFVDGTLFHLFHGRQADRRYVDRLSILVDQDFDPERDLARSEAGVLRWASDKPELHALCRSYFFERDEDSELHLEDAVQARTCR